MDAPSDAIPGGASYDADYFAHGCGDRPYRRDPVWLGFFGEVAERIVLDIEPETVLDVGCAMGFLVECLRERGVEAWGIDVSAYALANVHESVQPFCREGSALVPFDRRYDLITCIEVLEHLSPVDGPRAVANLCAHTDDVLFSSTPEDHREPTHLNVQPPEYWARAFARHGFFRDVEFDATFLTPWAARFRRHDGPMAPIVGGYERRLWWLSDANAQLRDEHSDLRRELRQHELRAEGLERALEEAREGEQRARAEADELRTRWERLQRSWVWRLFRRLPWTG